LKVRNQWLKKKKKGWGQRPRAARSRSSPEERIVEQITNFERTGAETGTQLEQLVESRCGAVV